MSELQHLGHSKPSPPPTQGRDRPDSRTEVRGMAAFHKLHESVYLDRFTDIFTSLDVLIPDDYFQFICRH